MTVVPKNFQTSAVKYSIDKPILLNLVDLSTICCPKLKKRWIHKHIVYFDMIMIIKVYFVARKSDKNSFYYYGYFITITLNMSI